MVHGARSEDQVSNYARFAGAAAAGAAEIITFHPVDTVAKRLMSNQEKVFGGGKTRSESFALLSKVIFKDSQHRSALSKYMSLFPGISYGAAYKVLQRVYKFAGQPLVNDLMNKHFKQDFVRTFGADGAKPWMHAVSGAMIGVGEVILLPLDVLKIISQTNPAALKGRGVAKIIVEENFRLYRGAAWTAARNAPGSFALFGGAAVAKEYIFKLKDYNQATFFQNAIASVVGSVASIVLSNPLDVIKTRIQNRNFDNPESGASIVRNLIKNEGFGAFFKGVIPKTAVVGPKLVFSFTIAQSLITYFDTKLAVREADEAKAKAKKADKADE